MHFLQVADDFGACVLRYLILPDGQWFGGDVPHSGVELDNGPHVIHRTGSMLDLIARLANADGHYRVDGYYTKNGITYGHSAVLRPEMMADDIARVLDIDPQEVVKRYGLLVRVTEKSDARSSS